MSSTQPAFDESKENLHFETIAVCTVADEVEMLVLCKENVEFGMDAQVLGRC